MCWALNECGRMDTVARYSWVIFAPWALLWLLSSLMTLHRARQKDWAAHRWWANLLSQSGLLFITGRVAIGFWSVDSTYWAHLHLSILLRRLAATCPPLVVARALVT